VNEEIDEMLGDTNTNASASLHANIVAHFRTVLTDLKSQC
jgi:hypothetical protein